MALRVSLAGRVSIDNGAVVIDEERLPGRQGRLVFAYLVIEQGRSVTRDELADVLWGETPPATWEKALGVIASKLRALLGECGLDGTKILASAFGCYRLELPEGSWVDLVAADRGVVEAAAALAAGEPEAAKALARQAAALARPTLLPGEDGAWIEAKRRDLADILGNALDCLAGACLCSGEPAEAARWAQEAIALHPFRESGYRRLMRAHADGGNGAEALRAYERCRRLLDEELGAYPSPETESIYRELLKTAPVTVRAAGSGTATVSPDGETRRVEASLAERDAERPIGPVARGGDLGVEVPAALASRVRRPSRRLAVVAALLVVGGTAFAVFGGLAWRAKHSATGLPAGSWAIGLDMPLSGVVAFRGTKVRNAVQLALRDVNAAGGIAGSLLRLKVYNDAGAGALWYAYGQDPSRGAANTRAMVADSQTIAMIGPWGSSVAVAELPLTNRSGLFQCSPANTNPRLTKPRNGALDLRSAYPTRINYVRLAPSDDIQAPALAWFAFHDLEARVALVIDASGDGRDIADGFQEAYTKLGGRAIRRALNPGADSMALLHAAVKKPPGVVFFGGFEDAGAKLRLAMRRAGLGRVPFLSWDGLLNGGSGAEPGSFLQQAGAAAAGTFISHASIAPERASFAQSYRATYGTEPDEYAAAAYACTEVIVASLRAIAANGRAAGGLREALRAYAVDPSHRYETILGTVGFDANGDSTQQFVTFYRVDPAAANGAGDWVAYKQQDFGPAP